MTHQWIHNRWRTTATAFSAARLAIAHAGIDAIAATTHAKLRAPVELSAVTGKQFLTRF